jgi:D-3-phosphoglycerate dehydrogenase
MYEDIKPNPLVIITAKVHVVLIERLQQAGYTVMHLLPDAQGWSAAIQNATGLVMASGLCIDESFLLNAPSLRWIARLGSGMELVDIPAAERRGIKVVSSPEGNCLSVGEHALGMLLSLFHKIASSYNEIQQQKWIRDANRGTELSGKTVGIIGFGHTGRAFAKVLSGFDVTILAHDKYISGFGTNHIKEASQKEVLVNSDVISLHLPLTTETFHYANEDFFLQTKKTPLFLNTSRGEVHDTQALINALERNIICGAALDVLENERLNTYTLQESEALHGLLNRQNVLITPHIAGYSHEAFYKMSRVLAEKLGL